MIMKVKIVDSITLTAYCMERTNYTQQIITTMLTILYIITYIIISVISSCSQTHQICKKKKKKLDAQAFLWHKKHYLLYYLCNMKVLNGYSDTFLLALACLVFDRWNKKRMFLKTECSQGCVVRIFTPIESTRPCEYAEYAEQFSLIL